MASQDLNAETKRKRTEDQLLDPNTQRFWADTLLHGDMPEDENGPIQDYVYPSNWMYPGSSKGTLDTMPNQFDQMPGWEPNQRGFTPSYLSPRVPNTLDRPGFQFPEDARTRT